MDNYEDVKLTPNVPRIIASIVWTIRAAERKNRRLTQYDVVKTLFLADREHLNEWGRPITYDNYVAMTHGPVPSTAYDLLKNNEFVLRQHEIRHLPWNSQSVPNGNGKRHYHSTEEPFDVDEYLSESDVEALEHALSDVLRLGFGQIRRLTHEDPAYLDAWRENGDRNAYDMKLALMFEEPNFERAALVAEQSEYV